MRSRPRHIVIALVAGAILADGFLSGWAHAWTYGAGIVLGLSMGAAWRSR